MGLPPREARAPDQSRIGQDRTNWRCSVPAEYASLTRQIKQRCQWRIASTVANSSQSRPNPPTIRAMRCPSCGTECPDGDTFCEVDGTRLGDAGSPAGACGGCGAAGSDDGDGYCSTCGAR